MPVVRLITYAHLAEQTATTYAVSLRHVACLADGREVLLLDDRGFNGSTLGPDTIDAREQIEQVETAHREMLANRLRAAGVVIDHEHLGRLAHDVVLDEALERAVAQGDERQRNEAPNDA